MEYKGIYSIFDSKRIQTYPISKRTNKVKLEDLIQLEEVLLADYNLSLSEKDSIDEIASTIVRYRKQGKPIIIFSGAHLVKNGLGPIIIDLIKRNMITLFAGNGATAIHDFELALIGETSEYVPNALEKGEFGMAYEFAYINAALNNGNKLKLGYGESLGRMIADNEFCCKIQEEEKLLGPSIRFLHPELSILNACYITKTPCTIHAGIGTDVIDQHPSFNGCVKGGCSGRDFLIYTNEIEKFNKGGVVLNIGSAVTGPEILLKAVSMVKNSGTSPEGIVTGDFDLRPFDPKKRNNESDAGYYFRDQKSLVLRIPGAFDGKGYYVQENQLNTIPYLYKKIIENLD